MWPIELLPPTKYALEIQITSELKYGFKQTEITILKKPTESIG